MSELKRHLICLNRTDGKPFDENDEARFAEFMRSIGVILEGFAKLERGRASSQRE